MTKSREWLLLNAVECWLHYYSQPASSTVDAYKQLREELLAAYEGSLSIKDAEDTPPPTKSPRKRTRNGSQSPAKTV
jgi:hypothetical protein